MSLVEYRRKRRFDQTKEPEPGKALPKGQRAIFVVQLHHASRTRSAHIETVKQNLAR